MNIYLYIYMYIYIYIYIYYLDGNYRYKIDPTLKHNHIIWEKNISYLKFFSFQKNSTFLLDIHRLSAITTLSGN